MYSPIVLTNLISFWTALFFILSLLLKSVVVLINFYECSDRSILTNNGLVERLYLIHKMPEAYFVLIQLRPVPQFLRLTPPIEEERRRTILTFNAFLKRSIFSFSFFQTTYLKKLILPELAKFHRITSFRFLLHNVSITFLRLQNLLFLSCFFQLHNSDFYHKSSDFS